MNINENTDLIGFIAWLICSCNLGQKQILLYHHNSDIQVLQIDIFFFYYIVLVIFFYQLLYDSIFFPVCKIKLEILKAICDRLLSVEIKRKADHK